MQAPLATGRRQAARRTALAHMYLHHQSAVCTPLRDLCCLGGYVIPEHAWRMPARRRNHAPASTRLRAPSTTTVACQHAILNSILPTLRWLHHLGLSRLDLTMVSRTQTKAWTPLPLPALQAYHPWLPVQNRYHNNACAPTPPTCPPPATRTPTTLPGVW